MRESLFLLLVCWEEAHWWICIKYDVVRRMGEPRHWDGLILNTGHKQLLELTIPAGSTT